MSTDQTANGGKLIKGEKKEKVTKKLDLFLKYYIRLFNPNGVTLCHTMTS